MHLGALPWHRHRSDSRVSVILFISRGYCGCRLPAVLGNSRPGSTYTNRSRKFRYFLWALARGDRSDRSCPSCANVQVYTVRRKFLVTALLECQNCGLRFRVPKDTDTRSRHFYQEDYEQGFTTDVPSDEQLKEMLSCRFKNTVKDYQTYGNVLQAIGIEPGRTVLDFGCRGVMGVGNFGRLALRFTLTKSARAERNLPAGNWDAQSSGTVSSLNPSTAFLAHMYWNT